MHSRHARDCRFLFVAVLCRALTSWHTRPALQLPFVITEIDENGPAGTDGRVRVGDVVLRVQDTDVSGKTTDEVTDLVRGEPGSEVSVTLSRAEFSVEESRLREDLGAASRDLPAQRQGKARKTFSIEVKRGPPAQDGECTLVVVFWPACLRRRRHTP